jgi:hypothetical protein
VFSFAISDLKDAAFAAALDAALEALPADDDPRIPAIL